MRDWGEVWLNEGFATYFVYDFLQREHPHLTLNEYYLRLTQLLVKQVLLTFNNRNLFLLKTSSEKLALVRPLVLESDIHRIFNRLHLYAKGCVLVRMIADLVGDFEFRAGIRRYLKRNAYRTVTRADLWASLPAYADFGAENERLAHVMDAWLENPGLPEVTVR